MKRKFLFMSVLASLFMAGCSQEEIAPGGENEGGGNANANSEVSTSYMAVNLMPSDITRAEVKDYEDGTDAESHVSKVRFYFFNGNGEIANVKLLKGRYVNFYDWTPGSQGTDVEDEKVTKELAVTLVINTQSGDKLPQQIAAVLNPSGDEFGEESKNLTQLKDIVKDFSTNTMTTSGNFMMFNSVCGKNGTEFCAVPIEAKHLQKKVEDAMVNPVTIYVERSVAKVKVSLNMNEDMEYKNDMLPLKDKAKKPLLVDGKQVYLKFGGWGLTADTDEGRLVKKINPKWTSSWWNDDFRSYWAINSLTAKNRYHKYNEIGTLFGADNALYTNENAQQTDEEGNEGVAKNHTKVIISGTLCDDKGNPFTMVRHLGAYFADTYSSEKPEAENFLKLKQSILNQMSANGDYYYFAATETNEEGQSVTVRNQIDPSDLMIVITEQQKKENSKNNCYVYAVLSEEAKGKTWYNSLDPDAAPLTNADVAIDESLSKVDKALAWKDGMTYYYYEIKHLGDATGVVRNHVYKTNVRSIAGFGTPVYDPNQVIYPEIPDPNDHYIAAQIEILSWRVVSTDYDLGY